MKGIMKGKLMKKLKSMKPIGYLKETRVLQVNAADGLIETVIENPSFKAQAEAETPELMVRKEVEKETVKFCSFVADQEPDVIDVNELMRDLEEEEEGEEMEVDEDKENVRPVVKARAGLFGVKDKVESKSLFYPNLLIASEKAVKEHPRVSEEEKSESIDRENLERIREAEPHARIQQENPEKSREAGRIWKTRKKSHHKRLVESKTVMIQVLFFERDVSMHVEFKEELWRILDGKVNPPRLFIKGRYIGGSEEVLGLHEQGWFRVLFEGIRIDRFIGSPCEGCAGVRKLKGARKPDGGICTRGCNVGLSFYLYSVDDLNDFPLYIAAMKSERISGSLAKTFWAMTKASTKRNEEIVFCHGIAYIALQSAALNEQKQAVATIKEIIPGSLLFHRNLDHLLEQSTISKGEALKYFREMVRGLDHIHGKKIIHGDLSRKNIFIDASNVIKVADFGLARLLDNSATAIKSESSGTKAYLAPEAETGAPIDEKIDI
ncbi:hypothetical protein DKX38_012095 [Salix brachista]|uniref:Protein kinase domain-containing protein n=1 Tax=Salix brachista TaxID=2182728 RepID=A0A5N5LMP2_9ROSI|nr:hypothetical protein DKX38_012095 [Salix brachista]